MIYISYIAGLRGLVHPLIVFVIMQKGLMDIFMKR